jgi:FkbM family methyltransferase
MQKIYFDVGANDGSSLIQLVTDPNNIIYAFEPTPQLVKLIRSKTHMYPNYHLIPKAVSDYEGKSVFNVAGQSDWGCSSLCHFSEGLDKTWAGRTDFKVTDQIIVDVIRLDKFVVENNITEIDYLHCDVQGHDLEVLMGFGDKINIIKRGAIEMPTNHGTKLYKQRYLAVDAVNYLEQHGFEIYKIDNNVPSGYEVNIYFRRC